MLQQALDTALKMTPDSIAHPGTFALRRWLGSGRKQPLNLNRCDKQVGKSGYHVAADGKQTFTVCLRRSHHLVLVLVKWRLLCGVCRTVAAL
jgi:hypothetical protein